MVVYVYCGSVCVVFFYGDGVFFGVFVFWCSVCVYVLFYCNGVVLEFDDGECVFFDCVFGVGVVLLSYGCGDWYGVYLLCYG